MAKILGSSLLNQKNQNILYTAGDNTFGIADNNSSTFTYSFSQQVGSETNWSDIKAIYDHSLGLKTDGTLWSWGGNANGQLATGDIINRSSPVQIGAGTNWLNIAAGGQFNLAVKTDGTLWAWGYNLTGQLGTGNTFSRSSPVQVGLGTNWSIVGVTFNSSYAIKTDGTLWSWGSSGSYLGDETPTTSPIVLDSGNWSKVSIYSTHCLAIKSDGTLWAWGDNRYGQLGLSSTINRSSPVQVGLLNDWRDVSTQTYSSLAIKTDNTLWGWGYNPFGQLGLNDTNNRLSPVQIGVDTNWNKIASNDFSSFAIKTDGTLWSWGYNSVGQLGLGDIVNRSSPTQIGILTDWLSISASTNNFAAIKLDGTMWACGENASGQLGQNNLISRSSPVQVGLLTNWQSVSVGISYILAIKTDGTLWAWGANGIGQLGRNNTLNASSPVQIGLLTDWAIVSAGQSSTSLAIKTDGSLWGWGNNATFQLGLSDYINRSSPVQIGSSNTWQNISSGSLGCLGINQNAGNNNLYVWGGNYIGTMGTGVSINRSSPIQIGSAANWSKISCGVDSHILATKTDGTIWAWGLPIGLGMGQPSIIFNYPIKIGSDTNWSIISAGNIFSLAIKTDGTLWAWGSGTYGQLGNSTTSIYYSPIQIGAATDWKNIFAGYRYSIATRGSGSNNQLWAWGNLFGESRIYSSNTSSPVLINAAGNWDKISGRNNVSAIGGQGNEIINDFYCMAINNGSLFSSGISYKGGLGNNSVFYKNYIGTKIKFDILSYSYSDSILIVDTKNRLFAWGNNSSGALGLNDIISRSSPSQVGSLNDWKEISVSMRISAGFNTVQSSLSTYCLAVKTDGTLWAWGNNSAGQLGTGDIINRSSPVQIGVSADWSKATTGSSSSFAIKTDGTLWAWGSNTSGQLGLGDVINRSAPVQVGLLTDWKDVRAGEVNLLAIKIDNTIWGSGSAIRSGTGGVARSSPAQIGSTSDWLNIACGPTHSFAVKIDGTLWAWGSTSYGKLGDNIASGANRTTPFQISPSISWKSACACFNTSFAVTTNGVLYGWGSNINFELGDGTQNSRSTPALISSVKNWILPNSGAPIATALFKL